MSIILATVVVWAGWQVGWLQPLEDLAYVALFRLRGERSWNDTVVVIEINDATLQELGQFPIARQHYATLLNQLAPASSTTVVLDFLFVEPSEDDPQLARAMEQHGHVVLAQAWDAERRPMLPTPQLADAAIATGHVLKDESSDGIARYIRSDPGNIDAISVAALQAHQLVSPTPITSPVISDVLWINWPSSAAQAPHYSFIDVLYGAIPAQEFNNKIVFVGMNASAADPLKTPYDISPPTSGVYSHAAAVSNLLDNRLLWHTDRGYYWILWLGGPCLGWWLMRWRVGRQLLTWLGVSIIWCCLSAILFHSQYWIPTTTPIVLFMAMGGAIAVSEQWRTYVQLRCSEERYALAVNGSNEGIWDWDLSRHSLYLSPRWVQMVGIRPMISDIQLSSDGSLTASPQVWLTRVHPEDRAELERAIAQHIDQNTDYLEHEYRLIDDTGTIRWMLTRGVVTRNRHGIPLRMAGSQTDVTSRKDAETQLHQHIFYDALTGLPNRALFLAKLQDALAEIAPDHDVLTVFLIDVDRFQLITNSLGHEWGDRVLIELGKRFQAVLSGADILARLGGDEYAVLSTNCQKIPQVHQFAETLQKSLSTPFFLNQREIFTSVSIGIVVNSRHYKQPEHWLRDADTALSNAKALGKNCYRLFQNRMRTVLIDRLELENDLRRVLSTPDCTGLVLHYQPIVYLKTGKIVGFEALVRWQHQQHGLIPPGRFIPMAEETGLIIPMGEWVLREACHQMKQWTMAFPQKPLFTVSVNLASKQCALPDLPMIVQSILTEASLDASRLKLELTESAIMDNATSIVQMLHDLRSLGLQLAIDDFGTGYSSLSYLRRFPIDNLKIDQSFVSNMEVEADSAKIIETIVDLAHSLGIDVTAEGLETLAHSTQLQSLQCEYGQGYFFSRPVDAEAATQLLIQEHIDSYVIHNPA
ncbi:MAG: EAL domain-containing protein [Cyanobacteria bacterium P01_E01_bin.6]